MKVREAIYRSALLNLEETLPVFDRLTVLDEDLKDRAFNLRLNLVHDLHGFDDADDGILGDFGVYLNIGRTFRRR